MEEILIIDDSKQICSMLTDYILPDLGYRSVVSHTGRQGLNYLRGHTPDLVLLDLQLPDTSGLNLLRQFAQEGYEVPVILMTAHGSESIAVEAFRLGARNYLIKPFSDTEAKAVIDQALRERRLQREKDQLTRHLQKRVQELTVLGAIGRSVSSLLDQEELLVRIVEAGVYITRAEEGFLLLHDRHANELYLRAAKNLGEARAQKLRMPIEDTLAGQVIRTGKPIRLDRHNHGEVLKVKTGFLVRALIQVPLLVGNTVIGVLAVDNQQSERIFSENDQYLLSTLADYAAIAIENARLYEQIKRSEERYRDLFTNAHDLIFTLDQSLHILSINKIGPALVQRAEQDLLGKSILDFCTTDTLPIVKRHFANLLAGRTIQPFEMHVLRASDTMGILEVSARLARDDETETIHCIARNLTERRRLEEQLTQAEKLSAIGQLVAGVAHELNNPLTSISGYTQLILRDTNVLPTVRDDLEHIHKQAERAARIVQNLLVFAREHKPERRMINLNDVIRDTLSLRAYQLRVDNINVVSELDPNLAPTVADPHQLQQVILNLLNNAHQAIVERNETGTITLRSHGRSREASDGMSKTPVTIVCSVTDTGIGIPESELNRIFDPFYTTKPVGQGTGLGLSICFGIIQEHSGRIWAQSEAGVGTTVSIELPLLRDDTTLETPNKAYQTAELLGNPTGHHILVVDDEEPVSSLLARLLQELGHQPVVANSGVAALQILQKSIFDLILTDVKMPGMSGFELYQRICQYDADLAKRVVFVTGDTMSAATQARIAQIGNPYIAKPFVIEQLELLVRRLLTQHPVAHSK
ncbi:MAG: DNA-binding response regulator, OmpR family, contains REC and winged-helix (wHTH) domain [Chloroflexi bacterium AL-W]|nr:DNA-binding response regulator, OmpR family, contains REC and winged-helix (wHTH) domain [Chloroflexi bacterium AL-N1]NOK68718.1 DNA-binding response regulator, OmpR family, contains REC and winged-helix (wHTH) domain [Chloroflexi bacterium AL-N10]NOK76204.1 DNA-binding response regulator, OmpR family, contains REC and winged-helix (wHTH) domain [Chloroflexi bacterium AL-N5]NOK84159.1 DNA-binding response regulator, OmpR family, contains REC and winged-helix (wHTH) domain [Chloroflexi bacteri